MNIEFFKKVYFSHSFSNENRFQEGQEMTAAKGTITPQNLALRESHYTAAMNS